MASVTEATTAPTQLGAALDAGVDTISLDQTVTFTQYVRVRLPLDGFIFWVKADLLSPSAIFNAAVFNASTFNGPPSVLTAAKQITAKGSLHFASSGRQDETETIAVHAVRFTSEQHIQAFAEEAPNFLYFATLPDGIQYTFGGRESFYQQAGLWHYTGDAVYPPMSSQVISSPLDLDTQNVVVSNSLPFWLAMDLANPPLGWPAAQPVPLYPSYLVPDNLTPPYGVVHIPSESTRGLQSAPVLGPTLSRSQLVSERVEVTLYGLRNFNVSDFLDYVLNYTLRTENFGIMNIPIIRDEKKTQVELSAIAMKKKITFEIDYYQERARNTARQLILSVVPSFDIDCWPLFRERWEPRNEQLRPEQSWGGLR